MRLESFKLREWNTSGIFLMATARSCGHTTKMAVTYSNQAAHTRHANLRSTNHVSTTPSINANPRNTTYLDSIVCFANNAVGASADILEVFVALVDHEFVAQHMVSVTVLHHDRTKRPALSDGHRPRS